MKKYVFSCGTIQPHVKPVMKLIKMVLKELKQKQRLKLYIFWNICKRKKTANEIEKRLFI